MLNNIFPNIVFKKCNPIFSIVTFFVIATSGAGSVASGGGESVRRGDVTPHAPPQRRLIKVDFDNLEVII